MWEKKCDELKRVNYKILFAWKWKNNFFYFCLFHICFIVNFPSGLEHTHNCRWMYRYVLYVHGIPEMRKYHWIINFHLVEKRCILKIEGLRLSLKNFFSTFMFCCCFCYFDWCQQHQQHCKTLLLCICSKSITFSSFNDFVWILSIFQMNLLSTK